MTVSSNFRWILISNLVIRNEKTVPAHVPSFTIEDVEKIIRKKVSEGTTHYPYQSDQKIMRIREVGMIHNEYFSFLVSIGDKDAPIPSYENFDTGNIRILPKDPEEGLSHSCHIIINKKLQDNGHLVLIEKIPGMNISSLSHYLRYIFNDEEIMKQYDHEGESTDYRPIFEIDGHLSSSLRDALENGKLEDIEFVSYVQKEGGHDEYGYIQECVQKATMVVKRGVTTDSADSFFAGVLNKFRKQSYEQMFVRVKTNQGQTKRTEVDTSQEDILSQQFVNNEHIDDFSSPLPQTYETMNDEVVSKMLTKMAKYIS